VAFGGAGGQHACAVAALLGIATVVVPADAGLLSALGLGAAVVERFAERQVLRPLDEVRDQVPAWIGELARQARTAVAGEGVPAADVRVRRRLVHLRLAGQEAALTVEWREGLDLGAAFGAAYRDLYGYPPPRRPVEVESLRVVASSVENTGAGPTVEPPAAPSRPADAHGMRRTCFAGVWREVPIYERERLGPGDAFVGPALVVERHSTAVVAPGWTARVDGAGALVLERGGQRGAAEAGP
jgi:5-oxoprolinase (ATP-hydrolysing)